MGRFATEDVQCNSCLSYVKGIMVIRLCIKKPTSRDDVCDSRHLSHSDPNGQSGGMDGTRTRDLRRDRPAF